MPRRHALVALAVAVCWGVNFVVIDVGLETFPPMLFAALRFTLIALPAVLLVGPPRTSARVVVAVGLTLCAGQFGFLFLAMDVGLPAGLASLVLQLQAVFTVGLAVALLGERPGRTQLVGIACAFAGIAIIAVGRAEDVPLGAVALCVAAAASWGTGNVITRAARPPAPFALLVWASLVAPGPLAALSLGFEGPGAWREAADALDGSGLLALGYVVVVSTFFGFGVWTWLLSRHPAASVAPFTLLVPVVGIAAAWVALDERPNAAELAGAVVVLAGLGLTTGALRLRRAEPTAPAVPVAEP